MIVKHTKDGSLTLEEPDHFRAFKLVLQGHAPGEKPALEGIIRYVADDHAFIDRDAVITLSGQGPDSEWRRGFDAMVEAAAKYGWIDAETGAIRAHIEWQ